AGGTGRPPASGGGGGSGPARRGTRELFGLLDWVSPGCPGDAVGVGGRRGLHHAVQGAGLDLFHQVEGIAVSVKPGRKAVAEADTREDGRGGQEREPPPLTRSAADP